MRSPDSGVRLPGAGCHIFLDAILVFRCQVLECQSEAGQVGEPFVDADDIADVAVAALTEDGHQGHLYELTGPRLLPFAEAVNEIVSATGREIRYIRIPPEAFAAGVAEAGLSEDIKWLLDYLFATVLDGRNEHLADGVRRALGREPRDFTDYARATAADGVWEARP